MKTNEPEKRILSEKTPGITVLSVLCIAMTVLAALLLYCSNVKVPFMMDDLWYSTDLRDGGSLNGIGDIIGSQVWHYMNWGGRVFTHGFLQLSLMCGERAADVINTLATLVLVFEICTLAKFSSGASFSKSIPAGITGFALAFGLLITCCPNFRMSMLWQAGCANYVYSSVWILFFYICYLRALDPEKKDLPLICFFIPILGLITGWSTENMGPSSCLAAALITFICIRKGIAAGRKKIWMIEGVISSFIGSAFCIVAPGNFIRKTDSADDLALTLPDRLLQMLKGAGDYMFPSLIVLAGAFIAYKTVMNKKISLGNAVLLFAALLSYGAMIASPHYPDRAAYGTCVLIETVSVSLLGEAFNRKQSAAGYVLPIMLLVSSIAVMYLIVG
ncbi:MAG: DUF6056 family protein [Lachnospiraceae bacterium]|nr:DUF6056 family protein [Lachnospiraceae bacterium]